MNLDSFFIILVRKSRFYVCKRLFEKPQTPKHEPSKRRMFLLCQKANYKAEQVNSHSFRRQPQVKLDRKLCPYRLAVLRFHASLDLRVDPQRGTFSHGTEEKGFEIEENFVLSLSITGWLMRNY